jgi:hypothetical protein
MQPKWHIPSLDHLFTDDRIRSGIGTSLKIFGNGHCSQDANNGNYEHRFDQGKGIRLAFSAPETL